MKKILILIVTLVLSSLSVHAQLSENDKIDLAQKVKEKYGLFAIEGAETYKTKSGYQVLVVVTSVSASKNDTEQNKEARVKAIRMASEYLTGVKSSSSSVYTSHYGSSSSFNEEQSSRNSMEDLGVGTSTSRSVSERNNESNANSLDEKIVQTSMAQINSMQPLLKITENSSVAVYAYYLVLSKTAANNIAAGFFSIVPGAGQFYKGHVLKGSLFLGLTAASVVGIVVCEKTRRDYRNKVIEQPQYAKEYNTRAQNWQTARNVFIGVGGAIYLWNIIDAFATRSARQKVVTTNGKSLSIYPAAVNGGPAVGFAYEF